jgi:arylsulfatase A-like enzyme
VANHLVSRDNNFAAGFEGFHRIPHSTAAQLNRAFLNWIDDHQGERFFAYLHYMEPHMPYAAPGDGLHRFGRQAYEGEPDPNRSNQVLQHLEGHLKEKGAPSSLETDFSAEQRGYVAELKDLYDSEIAYWDERFAMLVDELETRGILENTVIVVTSDHGEEFMEHGLFRHGQGLHTELLSVPLIFLNTDHPSGRRGEMVGLLDAAPTLLGLAGIPEGAEKGGGDTPFAGFDLFGESTQREFLFAETAHGLHYAGAGMHVARAVFSEDWKAIVSLDDGKLKLYDRREDAHETNDRAAVDPGLATRMEGLIENWVRRCREAAPYNISLFDASALDEMRAMGYLK